MKLFTGLVLCGLGLTTAIFSTQGCSSSDTTTDAGTSSASRKPPAKEGDKTTATDSKFYALYSLSLGDADRSGAPSSTAWKKYGYDIDGLASTDKSTDHCKLKVGAPNKFKIDGEDGIDNSFGANILPVITTASPDAAKSINDSLKSGQFTVIIQATGLNDAADQTNTGLTGQLFAGAAMANAPKWDGSDEWTVLPALLNGSTVESGSKVKFADAYVNKGVFVSGSDATVTLSLSVGGAALDLNINKATISFKKPAAGAIDATEGTIAGVLNTEQLISELRKVAGRVSPTLCSGTTFDSIASQIRQASDIQANGSNSASAECDGISIGIGFTAKQVKAPTKVAENGAPSPDPCTSSPDAGAQDSGTD
jgi:hypothetical protein